MNYLKGFGPLGTPSDLLNKLRHDHERLRRLPTDTYAAFDFFVTGHHMLDWLYPDHKKRGDNKKRRDQEENKSVLLQVCSHIANGVKHFHATAKKHKSVSDVKEQGGVFQGNAFQPDAFQVETMIIQLDDQAARELGAEIECLTLAKQVLQYWEKHPDINK